MLASIERLQAFFARLSSIVSCDDPGNLLVVPPSTLKICINHDIYIYICLYIYIYIYIFVYLQHLYQTVNPCEWQTSNRWRSCHISCFWSTKIVHYLPFLKSFIVSKPLASVLAPITITRRRLRSTQRCPQRLVLAALHHRVQRWFRSHWG